MSEPVIKYVDFDSSVASPRSVILYDEKESIWLLRKMSDMKPSMMTLIDHLDGQIIDKHCVYYLLPCYVDDLTLLDRTSIVSVRWKEMTKGKPGGFFRNNIMIDIWDNDNKKNISLFISKGKIKVAGVVSYKSSKRVVEFLIEELNGCLEFYKKCYDNPKLFIEASGWLEFYSSGEREVIEKVINPEMGIVCTEDVNVLRWPSKVPEQYEYYVNEIVKRYVDLKYSNDIKMRSMMIINCGIPCSFNMKSKALYTSMVNYNFELGFDIDRVKLVETLSKMGYLAVFNTSCSHEVVVTIVDNVEYEDDIYIMRKENSKHEETFRIGKKGKIMYSGDGWTRMETAYYRFMVDLIKIYDNECNDAYIDEELN